MREENVPVLIVGAGPVGLATALELGLRDVRCFLADRRDGSTSVPKTSLVSARNMEFCRRWGIAERVRSAVWDEDRRLDFVYADSLTGREIARWPLPSNREQRAGSQSPEAPTHCPQLYFDPILKARVEREPSVAFHYLTSLVDFREDDDCVVATLTRERETFDLRCDFLIGCDGSASFVRDRLGIELEGRGDLAQSVNIFFEHPNLVAMHDKGWARIYRMVDEGGCWSELIPIDGDRLWRLTVFDEPASPRTAEDYLRRAFGADIPVRLLDISTWRRSDYIARSYGSRRVLLAGDSAHQCSPTSGLGMATGLEDAMNLAWKVAAILHGWGGPHLIPSYEQERKPIGARNVALSTRAFESIRAIPPRDGVVSQSVEWRNNLAAFSTPEFTKLHYVYDDSPICLHEEDGEAESVAPLATPGSRAPHGWTGSDRSILDAFGPHFTLLRFNAQSNCEDLVSALSELGAPVRAQNINDKELENLYGHPLALVRPDGHVGWRGAQAQGAQARRIAHVVCGF